VLLKLAEAAFAQGAYDDAADWYQKIYEEIPDNKNICSKIGISLAQHGKFEEALKFLIDALKDHPNDKILLNFMGLSLSQTGDFINAEKYFRKLIRFGGGDDFTLSNLAAVLNELGRFDEAERIYKTSLRRRPDNLVSQYNLGLLKLLKGNFMQGWQGFELRNAAKGIADFNMPNVKRWQGECVDGCRIFLYSEQGLGDTIQFARYAAELASFGAEVIIQCDDALADLMLTIDGVAQAGLPNNFIKDIDYYTSLLSLPKVFQTKSESIPGRCPYISVPAELPKMAVLDKKSELIKHRIGLVWAGNAKHKSDRTRSIDLKFFTPLLARKDIKFYSLQAGESTAEIDLLEKALRPSKIFPNKRPLTEVGSAMQHLDLVISVDTSLAHLAGALSIPVWTLISFYPDWRWMLNRSDSPWYPSMRLFRQPNIGNWQAVIDDVDKALDTFVS